MQLAKTSIYCLVDGKTNKGTESQSFCSSYKIIRADDKMERGQPKTGMLTQVGPEVSTKWAAPSVVSFN